MQGFNMGRYIPPEIEGTKLTANALHGRRPPGTRRGAGGGQTVRFEMPFAIWCTHCPRPTLIGQGVRFNAEKTRDGAYHTTPIWRFRMRHADCGGEIVVRTDPRNTAYEVLSGARKRDHGPGAREGEEGPDGVRLPILTDGEREALRKNAFAKLERTIDDREQLLQSTERIDGLLEASARHWDDPYTANQRLRKAFRKGRHEREREAVATEGLRARMGGLGIELLPESEEDVRRAAVVDFGLGEREEEEGVGDGALAKPLFGGGTTSTRTGSGKLGTKGALTKAEREMARRKDGFVSRVIGNTRAVRDPFPNGGGSRAGSETKGSSSSSSSSPSSSAAAAGATRLPGVKRKREANEEPGQPPRPPPPPPPTKVPAQTASGLVNYDDSD